MHWQQGDECRNTDPHEGIIWKDLASYEGGDDYSEGPQDHGGEAKDVHLKSHISSQEGLKNGPCDQVVEGSLIDVGSMGRKEVSELTRGVLAIKRVFRVPESPVVESQQRGDYLLLQLGREIRIGDQAPMLGYKPYVVEVPEFIRALPRGGDGSVYYPPQQGKQD